jgi:hypothetical protein
MSNGWVSVSYICDHTHAELMNFLPSLWAFLLRELVPLQAPPSGHLCFSFAALPPAHRYPLCVLASPYCWTHSAYVVLD